MKTLTSTLLGISGCLLFVLAPAQAAESEIHQMQGEWTLTAMTWNGIEVPPEQCAETTIEIRGDRISIDKFWQPVFTKIDPITREADGYLDGDPGHEYRMKLYADRKLKQVDLTLSGMLMARPDDYSRVEKSMIRELIRDKAIQCKGIYSLEGDQLTICFGDWMHNERDSTRPDAFTAGEHSERTLLVMRRK